MAKSVSLKHLSIFQQGDPNSTIPHCSCNKLLNIKDFLMLLVRLCSSAAEHVLKWMQQILPSPLWDSVISDELLPWAQCCLNTEMSGGCALKMVMFVL